MMGLALLNGNFGSGGGGNRIHYTKLSVII